MNRENIVAVADDYADAIIRAMDAISRTAGAGSMNDAIGALVSVQAALIATVGDRKARRSLVQAIERTLPVELAKRLAAGPDPSVNVVIIKRAGGIN